MGKISDDFFGHSIIKIFLVFLLAQVDGERGKNDHGDEKHFDLLSSQSSKVQALLGLYHGASFRYRNFFFYNAG